MAVAGRIGPGQELLAGGIDQDDERAGVLDIRREAIGDGQRGVLGLDVFERADLDLAAEAAGEVRPDEADGAGGDLEEPEAEGGADRRPQQLPARQALDLLVAQRLERLAGQRLWLVGRFDLVVAPQSAKWKPFVLFWKNGRYGMTKL